MFGYTPEIRTDYLFNPDEAYMTDLDFENIVGLIKEYSKKDGYSIDNYILVVEVPDGVFIRCQTTNWCRSFTALSKAKDTGIKLIGVEKWTDITRKYREPINLFGDNKLVRWRVGF